MSGDDARLFGRMQVFAKERRGRGEDAEGQARPPVAAFLMEECANEWRMACEHAFVREMVGGTLPQEKFARYLAQDFRFLDAFSKLLAAVLYAGAHNLEERRFGASFLALVTSEENDYFVESFRALGVPADAAARRRAYPDQPAADAFIAAMRSAADRASDAPHEAVALLVVCEGAYQAWAEEALAIAVEKRGTKGDGSVQYVPRGRGKRPLPRHIARWIELHSGEGFAKVVAYFKGLLDSIASRWSDEEAPMRLAETRRSFVKTCMLEKAFWEMAYEEGSRGGGEKTAALL